MSSPKQQNTKPEPYCKFWINREKVRKQVENRLTSHVFHRETKDKVKATKQYFIV